MIKIKRAIISVFDKTDLDKLVRVLERHGVEIVSTGGTRKFIEDMNVKVKDISEYTGFPEILNGRVKTLHPKIYGGILYRRSSSEDIETIKKHLIDSFDLVVVNLYPFEKTIVKEGVTKSEAIENIDIGGVTLLRGGAKSHDSVVTLSGTSYYEKFILELENNKGRVSSRFSLELALKAFETTSFYDSLISNYFRSLIKTDEEPILPEFNKFELKKVKDLRYGENPHQKASVFNNVFDNKVYPETLHGKELSYNNMVDIDAAFRLVSEFKDEICIAIIKHTNPCGVAISKKSQADAYIKARASDPISFFGGIVAASCEIEVETAKLISESFIEAVIAPSFSNEALDVLKKKKNIRLIKFGFENMEEKVFYKETIFGHVAQEYDFSKISPKYENKTDASTTSTDMETLDFAMKVCKHVKSNAIVLAKDLKTVGIGAGQMSRIDALKIALEKAGDKRSSGAIMASDAFFPFPDCVKLAGEKKISAIAQPGGSKNDESSIDEANRLMIPLFFTGIRHFKH